jgi:copper chaperone
MFEFTVADMSCGHCVSAITKAVKEVEPQAVVEVDLAAKTVRVDGTSNADGIRDAISRAGFTPLQAK